MQTDQIALLVVEVVSSNVGVEILEDLIEAELAESLGRVADQGGEPALDHTYSACVSGQCGQCERR